MGLAHSRCMHSVRIRMPASAHRDAPSWCFLSTKAWADDASTVLTAGRGLGSWRCCRAGAGVAAARVPCLGWLTEGGNVEGAIERAELAVRSGATGTGCSAGPEGSGDGDGDTTASSGPAPGPPRSPAARAPAQGSATNANRFLLPAPRPPTSIPTRSAATRHSGGEPRSWAPVQSVSQVQTQARLADAGLRAPGQAPCQ